MTYFGFLVRFLLIPILLLAWLNWRDERRGKQIDAELQGASPYKMLALLVAIALIYTTPWDNYLVATSVWWYDPALVTGVVLGWVPIEEYTFFILQPILVGLWLFWWARRLPGIASTLAGNSGFCVCPRTREAARGGGAPRVRQRIIAGGIGVVVWLVSLALLLSGWQAATYLGLELVWALPPIILQLFFGADILLRHWRLLLVTLLPMTLYLSTIDSLAIDGGTWTIDPAQSLGILIGGVLPLEELTFFLLTTLLVTLGLILGMAKESWGRLPFSATLERPLAAGQRSAEAYGQSHLAGDAPAPNPGE